MAIPAGLLTAAAPGTQRDHHRGRACIGAVAVAAPDPGPVRVAADGGGVPGQAVVVAAGAVLGGDVLGGFPGGPVHDRGVDGPGCAQPLTCTPIKVCNPGSDEEEIGRGVEAG
jgi:hypothetical protein